RKLEPGAPIRVIPDADGEVTLVLAADGLNAPEITAELPGGARTRFRPDAGLQRRMAGGDPRFPVSAERMRAAGLLPGRDRLPDEKAEQLARLLRASGSARLGEESLALDETSGVEVFSFEFAGGMSIEHHHAAAPSEALAFDSGSSPLIGDFLEW